MAIIGIDLGTTNSLACIYRNGAAELIPNGLNSVQTSSAVSIMEDDAVLVGAGAKERLISCPEATAASFKVFMGTQRALSLSGRSFLPEELSALVLRQLLEDARRYLGEDVTEAVISVPAYFNDDQRCATKLAAQLAGLTVKRLINEPSAAALYYRYSTNSADGQMMIIDFGGGTLDVSIVECFENIIEIIAIAGDNHLGGDDIDRAIVACFCQENGLSQQALAPGLRSELYRQAEAAKIALSDAPSATISLRADGQQYHLTLTHLLLRKLCQPVFDRVRSVIQQAMKNRNHPALINDVVLVGGSSQLPVFGDFLEEQFGQRPAVAANPEQIVALGVGLCAGMKERAEDLQDLVMTDVCPFSLGVATYNSAQDKTPHMAFLIQRSSMLPASHQGNFYTLHDNQQSLRFEIYQGEGYYASENLKLGELEVQVPPGAAGQQYASVTFTYDIDGILHVSAKSSGGDIRERLLLNSRLRFSEEEQQRALERIAQIRLEAQGSQRERLLLEKALRLYQQAIGRQRDALSSLINDIRAQMEFGDLIGRQKMLSQVSPLLDNIEARLQTEPELSDFWGWADESADDNFSADEEL